MKKDNLIFLHKLFKAIADSIIKVFIPLYILKETNSIQLAMGYLIIYSIFVLTLMILLKKFIEKYGTLAIMLHFIFIVATMGVLSFVKINFTTVVIVAVLMSFSQAFYSIPLNLIFTFGDKRTNVGKFQIATNIGKLVFTLISGYILSSEMKNSFLFLSISSSIFYIVSIVPLIFSYQELKINYKHSIEEKKDQVLSKIPFGFHLFHIAFGLFQPLMDNVIPLYLYINNLSFKAVTLMIVLVELIKIFINMFSQKMVKKNKDILLVSSSFAMYALSIPCMLLIKIPAVIYVFSCICSVSFPLTFVPMFRLYCNYLREHGNVFNGITYRDIDIFSLRAPLYAFAFIGLGLAPCFIVSGIAGAVMLIEEIKLLKTYKKELK